MMNDERTGRGENRKAKEARLMPSPRSYCRLLTVNCGVGLKADATWLSAVIDRRYR